MSKENSANARALIEKAQALLQQALGMLGNGSETHAKPKHEPKTRATPASGVDFDTPFRAFIKRHAAGMSGARKFTLLVAYIAKGDVKKSVDLAEIRQHWNKVKAKGLLGMSFNPKYTSEAKEHDWVDASAGAYVLRPHWKGIFD
jgi:hypothetical protein